MVGSQEMVACLHCRRNREQPGHSDAKRTRKYLDEGRGADSEVSKGALDGGGDEERGNKECGVHLVVGEGVKRRTGDEGQGGRA